MTRTFLIIPRVRVINANAMSAPFIIGLPSITSFMGFTHKLQLDIQEEINRDIRFLRTGISIHSFNLRAYKEGSRNLLSITRNPLKKDGTSPSFVEEAKCNFEVSIVIEVSGLPVSDNDKLVSRINNSLLGYKVSSGDLLSFKKPFIYSIDLDKYEEVKGLLKKLMLGYVLTERKDLIIKRNNEEKRKNSLDSLLDYLKVFVHEDKDNIKNHFKIESGWLVPITVGYHGLTTPEENINECREPKFNHVFCESLVTLGEFKLPTTINNIDDFLWKYAYESEKNYFYCTTHN
ncbi:type I-F CRISPR-associated protein Csy2 [Taylorella equigenitalis]|uniref:type I-F CRISPR-associated protein Csy2 n=1 Tax=Taylorella equigenitalis TaxID=29575 RepID=UPI0004289996|nr:type I-F CRISPR-associated protein Csy2 [Taylorella equigenitalis]ASY29990.1 type I-F CRISPR-associated protein Csy2 [Taylorella equigenitalis]KOS59036.1 CRISPR-associated protein Cas5 [Taylorella equigenitalis]